ncbi:MAG: glutathione S-transferase family protein [Myxococcota bacterium]
MTAVFTPLRVYGAEVSYFTGKLEGYLRYKEIPYERISTRPSARIARNTGVAQMPAVQLADGRWLTDTTPIIAWLETQFPEPRVIPADPLQSFFSRLLEDYGDEWLWRPAMHYRWFYRADAAHLSRKIVDELAGDIPLPAFLKRFAIRTRQRLLFTRGDGVTRKTRAHVEGSYLQTLQQLRAMLAVRPFLLGDVPTLADFGFFGSMFRHFGLDPTASRIMRETAADVYAWVARVWDARASRGGGALAAGIPSDWGPVLDSIGSTYLLHLCANAEAWAAGKSHFEVEIEGVRYRRLRTARYRVWCLEQLRSHYDALPEPARHEARSRLEKHGCWEPLWRVAEPASGIDPEGRAPFANGSSMTGLR